MSLLMRNATVTTRYGGGFVQSIDGLSGGQEAGTAGRLVLLRQRRRGPQGRGRDERAPRAITSGGTATTGARPTDVPAVVGSFPEPFLNGIEGKRLPVRVECAAVAGYACRTVTARLRALGVPAAIAAIGSGGRAGNAARDRRRRGARVDGDPAAQAIERGPRASGVYARFSAGGQTLDAARRDGRPTRTLAAGAGLIAATRNGEDAPVWVVTGTDARGRRSRRAARSAQARSHDRFAVALAPAGALALPEAGP